MMERRIEGFVSSDLVLLLFLPDPICNHCTHDITCAAELAVIKKKLAPRNTHPKPYKPYAP